jgi:tetratricopeptide (TPR) repeat protein
MQRLLSVVVVVGSVVGFSTHARAERRVNGEPTSLTSCPAAVTHLTAALSLDPNPRGLSARTMLIHRCEADRWSRDAKLCFVAARSGTEASLCLDTLSKAQRKLVEGDADRLDDRRLSRWLVRGTLVAPSPIAVTLASYDAAHEDPRRARMLRSQAMSAYQAGNYDVSSKKFAAAVTASPTAHNIYLAAQAYRMKGERARAIELYERYLELSPSGPAAPACRFQLERLRDALP